jgi:DNA invertase Pin-like site-specific DNA recombinase
MIVIYARVSATEQTTAHQRIQAEQAGFKIDRVVADEGISGVSTRLAERPEGKRLFDMLRTGDTLVVRWVDRLGPKGLSINKSVNSSFCEDLMAR